eukprot:Pompholyxophrys_punicea_v1_NODE_616_length_1588_cov_5.891063.p2 type:complete len:102 gc:universal NODE_616_length_1588_cov_5.891063:1465-1160(-)
MDRQRAGLGKKFITFLKEKKTLRAKIICQPAILNKNFSHQNFSLNFSTCAPKSFPSHPSGQIGRTKNLHGNMDVILCVETFSQRLAWIFFFGESWFSQDPF